jgi:two-component system sensor histidine kinase QseC
MLGFGYSEAHEEVHELADARLQQSARTLMLLDLKRLNRVVKAEGQDGDRDIDDDSAPLGFQVWSDEGELLLQGAKAPSASFRAGDGFATFNVDHRQWRSYASHDHARHYQVRVFEPMRARDQLLAKLARRMAQVLLLALPLLAFLIWIGIGRGLRPLEQLSHAIATRNADNLDPIPLEQVPTEAQALTDALNHLLHRLARSIEKERSFTSDAAHELRTPLAAIKVQAQVALAARDDATRHHAIEQVIAGVNRTTHLAQQLLLLARLDHIEPAARQAVDVGQLVRTCIARHGDEAARRGVEIIVTASSHCVLQGDPAMLAVMVDNLLDNAIKYGRARGHVEAVVTRETQAIVLCVKDDGEGVAPEHRQRLQDRFFRAHSNEEPGSGLGLSIVEKIATVHDGAVSIGEGLNGHGLGVTIRFRA